MSVIISWQNVNSPLSLVENSIHVWRISLLASAEAVEKYREILNDEECERADRFHFPQHRRHFIMARGALRHILSNYLALAPDKITFDFNDYSKPSIAAALNPLNLEFNLSHSGEFALVGVGLNQAIGIDIEYMNKAHAEEGIAQRFFSPSEYAEFCQVPADLKQQAFYNAWTRKEAFIKAVGHGLSYPLDQFDVSLDPAHPVKILHIAAEPDTTELWDLIAFTPAADYVAAIATKQKVKQIYYWDYTVFPLPR